MFRLAVIKPTNFTLPVSFEILRDLGFDMLTVENPRALKGLNLKTWVLVVSSTESVSLHRYTLLFNFYQLQNLYLYSRAQRAWSKLVVRPTGSYLLPVTDFSQEFSRRRFFRSSLEADVSLQGSNNETSRGRFLDFSAQGARIEVYGQLTKKSFMTLVYKDQRGQTVSVQSSVQWFRPAEHNRSVVGLRFIGYL